MNVLSLCDGISCGMVALERARIKVDKYYSSEIEPHAIKVSEKNYPNIIRLGDMLSWKNWDIEWGKIDLILAGTPCQSLSIVQSKTRRNLNGKSKLFFTAVDILNHVKRLNTKVKFVFENVASMSSESKETISSLLCCEPIFIDSADFSAQSRPRYYWCNFNVSMDYEPCKDVLFDIMEINVDEKYFYKHPIENIDTKKQICATMVLNVHDMHKRVFNPHFKIHTLTAVSGGYQHKKVMIYGRSRKLTPIEYERLQTLPDNYTQGISDTWRYTVCGNGWTVDVIAYILSFIKKGDSRLGWR